MNYIEYQKDVVTILNHSLESNHLAHAYIFEGEKGSGLMDVAIYLASRLLCYTGDACGVCENCKRVMNGTHSNVIIIEPISNNIRKDQINGLIHEGQMSSVTDKNRIFIIKDAQKMNRSAANTLLKFLEEPTPNNYLILFTENIHQLLDTIVSRTQLLRFKPINKLELTKQLNQEGIEKDVAYILAELFGSIDDAKAALKEGSILNAIDMAKKVINAKNANKDQYLEYYFNKKLLISYNVNLWFLEILTLFKREQIKYLEKNTCDYFQNLIVNQIHDLTLDEVIKQIDMINTAIERLNAKVNSDLIYASLFQIL